jgi:hypothetical protein
MSILNDDFDNYGLKHNSVQLQELLNDAEKEIKELNQTLGLLKNFCAANNLDLTPLVGATLVSKPPKRISEMTKEELIEANKAVIERQSTKVAKSPDVTPMPTYDELSKAYEEGLKNWPLNALDTNTLAAIFLLRSEIERLTSKDE